MGSGKAFAVAVLLLLPVVTGCSDRNSVARAFYSKNVSEAEQARAIQAFAPREKWYIFAYGMQAGSAHAAPLSAVIAQDGKRVLDAMAEDLQARGPDMRYLDATLLFGVIQDGRRYDICADQAYYQRLTSFADKIGRADIRQTYSARLVEMCAPAGKP